ncbi:MAG: carboxymuconolactone decarboxylase family protein [Halioglobus sp.]|nr:carboxymuconolactone decarboxylase family protein [Halioglobus sp.]
MSSQPRARNPAEPTGNMIADSALGLVPETLAPYLDYNRMIWEEGPLSPAEIEVARLRNARRVNCVFCKNVRYDIALQAGLTEERVAMIDEGYRDSGLSEREKLIVAFVDQYYDAPGTMSKALRNELQAGFSARELAHLSLAIAHFSGFSRCAVALGGMPADLPVMEISLPG